MYIGVHYIFSFCTDEHWILYNGYTHHLETAEEEKALSESDKQGKVSLSGIALNLLT